MASVSEMYVFVILFFAGFYCAFFYEKKNLLRLEETVNEEKYENWKIEQWRKAEKIEMIEEKIVH